MDASEGRVDNFFRITCHIEEDHAAIRRIESIDVDTVLALNSARSVGESAA